MTLRYTLRADGPTDAMLMPILRWSLERALPGIELEGHFADPRFSPRNSSKKLVPSSRAAIELYPCDILFVHRDAEREDLDVREREIEQAIAELPDLSDLSFISVIPVRMSEAWLLIDEAAIRRASGNPNGKSKIELPRLRNLEKVPDPKRTLREILRNACELRGRRLKAFRAEERIPLIAELIKDFSPLLDLPAFQRLHVRIGDFCRRFLNRTRAIP